VVQFDMYIIIIMVYCVLQPVAGLIHELSNIVNNVMLLILSS